MKLNMKNNLVLHKKMTITHNHLFLFQSHFASATTFSSCILLTMLFLTMHIRKKLYK